ncbi:MAG TPA: ATPase domain-containing protein [Candidatus Bathyarchaeia archaeon]|nr:ATPase domain-containing protein [Candidatus Bathyarchaeia archaeon]
MKSFGWDVDEYLKNGTFRILDCYSALAGVENPQVRDPVDFTETGIQVTSMIENAKGGPIMIVMDSIAPIFNGVQPQTTINFLRALSAKVKNNNGILVLAGSRGSIPEEVRSNVDNLVDGVIELNAVQKGGSTARLISVKRLAGRKTSPVPAEFEIVTGKGIVFVKRISLKVTHKRQTS